ncbi:hypothetical protein [Streptomyces sp. BBFR2]|uniref:hypothetical protein n=1 Tax=Streptomyces sp. BBFR2 TaxID=3372854 RepID=UPI0037DA5E8E
MARSTENHDTTSRTEQVPGERPRLPLLGACGCGAGCSCGCQGGAPCQCGGSCG